MTLRFGRFEFDEAGRSLLLDGKSVQLQPRVFDVLAYLVSHQERVVPKLELLAAIWPDVVVTDASLQRAVSVLRTVLRSGGSPDAVQTFARHGYKFSTPIAVPAASNGGGQGAVEAARALAHAREWRAAHQAFEALGNKGTLEGGDYELWGRCAQAAGVPHEAVYPLERAVAEHLARQDQKAAGRAALELCNLKLEARETAVAKGWHQRAGTLLAASKDCRERGMHLWLAGRIAMFEGKLDETARFAGEALAMGRRLADADLECLGLTYSGHIELAQGDAAKALAMLDEAGAAALSGSVSTWVGGVAFCSVIWAYLHQGDYDRGGQWSQEFSRWCEQNGSFSFPALCRLHRGEVMAARGELGEAEREVLQARTALAIAGPFVEGDAHRVLGEIRLYKGDYTGAEEAFRKAVQLGWAPLPGLALLLAARGKPKDAIATLLRALEEPGWTEGQRRAMVLCSLGYVAARAGEVERARWAVQQLEQFPQLPPGCQGNLQRARAELALTEGDLAEAIACSQRALQRFLTAEMPVHAAHARMRLAELLLADGDTVGAELELAAAEDVFRQVSADPMLEQCRQLRRRHELSGTLG